MTRTRIAVAAWVLPATAQTDLDGQSREFRASGGEIWRRDCYFTFVLALLFIYLVLAAQFESFVHPFVIMLSILLSMTGGRCSRSALPQPGHAD